MTASGSRRVDTATWLLKPKTGGVQFMLRDEQTMKIVGNFDVEDDPFAANCTRALAVNVNCKV